ncbi:porin [Glaciimonas sp. GG7]
MQKSILSIATFATLATLSAASYAQSSVTFYGTVDAGVAYTDNGAVAPKASNALSVTSGILVPSRWGFMGTEDLGDGLKAKFQLEAGFDSDTGAMKTYSGNPSTATPSSPGGASINGLFNRRSFVGLEGHFGSLSFGRDYTPLYWTVLDTDVQKLGLYGNVQQIVLLSGTGSDRFGRASNAVFYVSPELDGFQGRAMFSFGSESPGGAGGLPSDANHMWAVSGRYAVDGLLVSGTYQQIQLPTVVGTGAQAAFDGTTGARKDAVVGVKYTFGNFSVATGYFQTKQPIAHSDTSDVWLGGTATLGTGTVLVNLQRMRQDAAVGAAKTANVFALSYVYPLSKRTSLYATSGILNNSSTAAFALVASDPAVGPSAAGATVKALALGIRHNF